MPRLRRRLQASAGHSTHMVGEGVERAACPCKNPRMQSRLPRTRMLSFPSATSLWNIPGASLPCASNPGSANTYGENGRNKRTTVFRNVRKTTAIVKCSEQASRRPPPFVQFGGPARQYLALSGLAGRLLLPLSLTHLLAPRGECFGHGGSGSAWTYAIVLSRLRVHRSLLLPRFPCVRRNAPGKRGCVQVHPNTTLDYVWNLFVS